MKDKIFIYTPFSGSFYDKYLYHLANTLNYQEIIIGSPHNLNMELPKNTKLLKLENLNYWSKANDYKELNAIIDLLIDLKISRLHLLRYSYENLFSILSNHPNINNFNISIGVFGYREIIETNVRLNLFSKLVENNSLSSVLVHSISNQTIPFILEKFRNHPKVHFVSDPIYDDINDYNLDNIVNQKIKLLYFGTFFYGKGVDILVDASKKITNNNHILTIAGDATTANFDISKLNSTNSYNLINKYLSEKDVLALMKENNVLILPYRNTYENGTSGVLVQAALANRLMIVPDIFPFNEVVNKYSLGLTFNPGSSDSLAIAIDKIVENYYSIYSKAKFKEFVENISTWNYMSNLI
jgi:glycosyltransferase involved in cell wall biosynthesis